MLSSFSVTSVHMLILHVLCAHNSEFGRSPRLFLTHAQSPMPSPTAAQATPSPVTMHLNSFTTTSSAKKEIHTFCFADTPSTAQRRYAAPLHRFPPAFF